MWVFAFPLTSALSRLAWSTDISLTFTKFQKMKGKHLLEITRSEKLYHIKWYQPSCWCDLALTVDLSLSVSQMTHTDTVLHVTPCPLVSGWCPLTHAWCLSLKGLSVSQIELSQTVLTDYSRSLRIVFDPFGERFFAPAACVCPCVNVCESVCRVCMC